MTTPYLTIDLDKIEHNAGTITSLCRTQGIRVTGVTKCTCGHPEVAKAMLRGGVSEIADSRLENIHRMQAAGVESPFTLLRLPALSNVDRVLGSVALSLNSELPILEALSMAACRRSQVHDAILMVDLGDLREGIWPSELVPTVREALKLPGIRIRGLGTNLSCFGGVVPAEDNMNQLVSLAEEVQQTFGITLDVISGLNSSGLELLAAGAMPARVNHARIGEAILLGRETIHRRPWPDTHQDAFLLHAEVLEFKTKPSQPLGTRSQDAFGALPVFTDRGNIPRALLNLGREDVDVAGITPLDPRIRILGASSGYLILDVSDLEESIHVGDEVTFSLNYSALLAAMTSEYVKKCPLINDAPVSALQA
jgi:predicted amino acid racemase